jgi:hypothetical protein
MNEDRAVPSRRGFLAAASGLAMGAMVNSRGRSAPNAPPVVTASGTTIEPFWGQHQSGILPHRKATPTSRLSI